MRSTPPEHAHFGASLSVSFTLLCIHSRWVHIQSKIMPYDNVSALTSLMSVLVACQLANPTSAELDQPPPPQTDELWQRLGALEMVPRSGLTRAMLRVADLPRKAWDLSDRACDRPPHHPLLDEYGMVLENIDLGAGPRPVLFRAPEPGKGTIVLVHGLFDSKYAGYLTTTATLLLEHGYGVLVPDMRWHGCRMDDSPPSLGPQEAQDLAVLSRWVRTHHPDSKVGLVGFSLGALLVGHALALDDAEDLFAAGGIGFSPPGDLEYTLDWLDRRPADVYALAFRNWIKRRMRDAEIPWRRGSEFRNAIEWLAHRWKYAGSADFLSNVDLAGVLPRVSRPLQLYVSADDPYFTPAAAQHVQSARAGNICVNVQITPFGGHIGHAIVDPDWFSASILTFFAASAKLSCALFA